jgi:hypothetical protein
MLNTRIAARCPARHRNGGGMPETVGRRWHGRLARDPDAMRSQELRDLVNPGPCCELG